MLGFVGMEGGAEGINQAPRAPHRPRRGPTFHFDSDWLECLLAFWACESDEKNRTPRITTGPRGCENVGRNRWLEIQLVAWERCGPIRKATLDGINKFFSPRLGDPKDPNYKGGTCDTAAVQHFLESVESVNIDSASDEVLAWKIGKASFTPNAKFVARDKAHGSRRL